MPKVSGYEVCVRLKGDLKTKDIPIIVVTASGSKELEKNVWHLGFVKLYIAV